MKPVYGVTLILAAAAIIIVAILALSNRYYVTRKDSGIYVKVDHLTGRTWVAALGSGWEEIGDSVSVRKPDKDLVSVVTGTYTFSPYTLDRPLVLSISNKSTTHVLTQATVRVQGQNDAGETREHTGTYDVYAAPRSTEEVSADLNYEWDGYELTAEVTLAVFRKDTSRRHL